MSSFESGRPYKFLGTLGYHQGSVKAGSYTHLHGRKLKPAAGFLNQSLAIWPCQAGYVHCTPPPTLYLPLPRSASFSGPQNYNLSFSGPLDQPPLPNDPLQALDAQRTAARSLSRTSSGRLVPVDSQGMVRSNSQTLLRTPSGPLSRSNSGQWEPGAIDYGNGTPRTPREEGGWASGGEDGRLPRGR